jgi:hypothetical protein
MHAAVLKRFGEPLIEAQVELPGIAPDEMPLQAARLVAGGRG